MHESHLVVARRTLAFFFVWLATAWLTAAPRPMVPAAQAARELAATGRIVFAVNGQERTLVLAPDEVALPLRGSDAAQLPPGAKRLSAGAQHQLLRLPAEVAASDWLEKTTAAPITSEGQSAGATTAASRVAVQAMGPVFYEEGRTGQPTARYIATTQLLLVGLDRTAAGVAATATGSRAVTPSATDELWVLSYDSPYQMLWAARELQREGRRVEPQFTRPRTKRVAPSDPLYPQQFYFKNTGQGGGTPGEDLNIEGLWPAANGAGVTVAVVDDGLELTHPDLAPNVASDPSLHRNVLDENNNPTPPSDANHGTICAGFIAARSNNGIGLTGAAPQARLIGVRLLGEGKNGDSATDVQEAAAFGWRTDVVHISSNSWGPSDDAETLSGPDTSALAALRAGVTTGRGGRGVVYFVATGNGRESNDHAGYDGYSGSRYVLAIGATDNRGQQAPFSESGPQVIVCAAGQTRESNDVQLLATDNVGPRGVNKAASPEGDYTTSGTEGTSYSTPQVAGVGALMLQANPNLGWRDVKEILIRTARKNDSADSDWVRNGAGFNFNHKYGAGYVDASAAVALASRWTNLGAELSATQASTSSSVIPDNSATGTSRTFAFAEATNLRVETVEVSVNVTHANRGQLRFELTSPAGTRTVLGAPRTPDTGANLANWVFSSPRHWGESGNGTWTVRVFDTVSGVEGSLTRAAVTLYGAAAAEVTNPGRLINLSLLTALLSADDSFTMGTVIGGANTVGLKPVLVRAAGPALGALGVGGTLPDPKLEFFSGSARIGENDDWGGTSALSGAFAAVGAFPYASAGSMDAAIFNPAIAAGGYSIKVSGSGTTGTVIAELYDSTPASGFTATTPRLVNVSVLKQIGSGFTVGFTVGGGSSATVLVRAIGPGLAAVGVPSGFVPDPILTLFSGSTKINENDDWGGTPALTTAFGKVGAFLVPANSLDAALLATLQPGSYSVQVAGVTNVDGIVIVEVYEVP